MEYPKTWLEFGLWSLVQFPVLGTCFFLFWWLYRTLKKEHAQNLGNLAENYRLVLELGRADHDQIVALLRDVELDRNQRMAKLIESIQKDIARIRNSLEKIK